MAGLHARIDSSVEHTRHPRAFQVSVVYTRNFVNYVRCLVQENAHVHGAGRAQDIPHTEDVQNTSGTPIFTCKSCSCSVRECECTRRGHTSPRTCTQHLYLCCSSHHNITVVWPPTSQLLTPRHAQGGSRGSRAFWMKLEASCRRHSQGPGSNTGSTGQSP